MTSDTGDSLAGRTIGPYTILSLLGSGGMGRVYRARDSRLGRDVAIKVLSSAVIDDPDRLARFDREARTLAALNHPHIAAIYGIEDLDAARALVLELVEGESLADCLAREKRLPIDRALTIARQIADALDAAHQKGIVHRDLKPANVMLQSGRTHVKLLDFGLAKGSLSAGGAIDETAAQTIAVTESGMILGTAAYMSPEQARGLAVDRRTDVWALACVLYEMLAGRRAFAGATQSDTLAAILTQDVDWGALPRATPPGVLRLLQRSLQKNPELRPRDVGDLRGELDHELSVLSGARRDATPGAARSWRPRLMLVLAAAVAIAAAIVAGALYASRPRDVADVALDPPAQLTDFYDAAVAPALSPDGRWLTFLRGPNMFFGQSAPRADVFVKMLTGNEPALQLTRDGGGKEQPVFSPDGSRIIYTLTTGGFRWDSWEAGMLGGTPPHPFMPNASALVWLGEHQLLYSEIIGGVHMKIVTSADNRSEHRDIYVPRGQGSMAHRSARSPDGTSVLIVEMDGSGWLPCRLAPFDGSSTGRQVGPLDGQCVTAAWSPDGRWMYFSSNAGGGFHIWRQRYPNGKPEQITSAQGEQEEGTTITADGRYLITSQGNQQAAIWLHEGGGERQLTTDGFAILPTMAASNDRVYYLLRGGAPKAYVSGELWSVSLQTGERQRYLPGVIMSGYSITADGRRVVYTSSGASTGDGVWIASLDPNSRTAPRQLTHGREFRAFASGDNGIVYMDEGDVHHLYRMNEDGSDNKRISDEDVVYLINASSDGRWALTSTPQGANGANADGTKLKIFPVSGGRVYDACDACVVGFGPARFQSPIMSWSSDGKWVVLSLKMYGLQTQQSILLPYDSSKSLEAQWPKGIDSEEHAQANPGAVLINEGNAYPANSGTRYLAFRQTTQANLWKIPLPR